MILIRILCRQKKKVLIFHRKIKHLSSLDFCINIMCEHELYIHY